MPLTVTRRKSTGALTITGSVEGRRICRRAAGDDAALAREEAAAFEAELLPTAWHGERRGHRPFAEAALSYLKAEPRSEHTKIYVRRILLKLSDVKLADIDQATAIRLRASMLPADHKPGTYLREVISPLRAVLRHARDLGGARRRA